MARIRIPFLGHTTHSNHEDGECRSIVNLRPKNGFKKPVSPRKTTEVLNNQYDIIFVHKTSIYENWIGIDNNKVYINIKGSRTLHATLPERINSVQQIGNTLSFVTDHNIYYSLYADENYTFLGEIPEMPDVTLTVSDSHEVQKKYTVEYGEEGQPPIPKMHLRYGDIDNTAATLYDMTKGLANIIIDQNTLEFSDSFLIRWAFRLYDGTSVIKHSSPYLVMHKEHFRTIIAAYLPPANDDYYGTDSYVRVKFFKVDVNYDFSSLQKWKDIIKSVDFYVTPYTGIQSPENMSRNFKMSSFEENGKKLNGLIYSSLRGSAEDQKETIYNKVINSSQFYHYYSENDFSGQKTVTFPNSKTTVGKEFANIIHQELMPVDSFSHHKIGAKTANSYNNRLRLLGVNTVLFNGFPIKNFEINTAFNGVALPAPATPATITMVTHIKTSDGIKYVKSSGSVSNIFLNPFISYPDSRASRIDFVTSGGSILHSVELTPHPSLNIAYHLNNELKPVVFSTAGLGSAFVPPAGITKYNLITELNKLKVSELNNPFKFPNETTYQIGSGEILSESSIIMNVTDRNYGMYPVFVFTTDGVFTMAGQTPDTVHSSIQAPTYMEPPVSNVMCPTPYGVVFATQRGLMIINQNQTKFISPQLREDDDTISFLNNDGSALEVPGIYPNVPFREYISGLSNMVYNPYNDEIIIANSDYPYCYVYDLATETYYISTEVINQLVLNTYPKVLVCEKSESSTKIKDYSQSEKKATKVKIITRPLSFKTTDIKKLDRFILRAIMYNVNESVDNPDKLEISLYYSDDSKIFKPATGRRYSKVGNYKDFDLGLLARMKYRHYLFMITGTIDEDSEIQFAEFEIGQEYNNEKMR